MSRKLLNAVLFVLSLGYLTIGPYISFLTFDYSLTMIENLTTPEIFSSGTVGGIILAFIGTIVSLWIIYISFSLLFPSLKVPYLKRRYLEERYVFLVYVSIVSSLIIGASWFLFNRHHQVNTGQWMAKFTIVSPIYLFLIVMFTLLAVVFVSRDLKISFFQFFKIGNQPSNFAQTNPNEEKDSFLTDSIKL